MRSRRDVANGTGGSAFCVDSRTSEINRTPEGSMTDDLHAQLSQHLRYAAVRSVLFSPPGYW